MKGQTKEPSKGRIAGKKSRDSAPNVPSWDPVVRLQKTLDLFHLYREEARRCKDTGAYLAGCVILGSALEAALLAMAQCLPDDVGRVVAVRKSKELSRPSTEWGLSQLLLLARDLEWLPTAVRPEDRLDPAKAQVGDYAEVIRVIRNLLHPSIYLRECPEKAISDKHLEFSFGVLDAACSCLAQRLRTQSSSREY